jgi:hypothetical protein
MPDQSDAEQAHKLRAVNAFLASSLVALVPGGAGSQPPSVGSGTLLRVGERLVVVTAAHVAEDAKRGPMRLLRRGLDDLLNDVVEAVDLHPRWHTGDELDVGLLVLRPEATRGLRSPAPPDHTMVPAGLAPAPPDPRYVLLGYPVDLHRAFRDEARATFSPVYSAQSLRSSCVAGGHPTRGLHLQWGSTWYVERTGAEAPTPHPKGISGGPVWLLPAGQGGVWAPTGRAQLVGVACAYHSSVDCERAESVDDWGTWFHGVVAGLIQPP